MTTSLKIRFAIVFLAISSTVLAQNYSPFNKTVTKRFYNSLNPKDNTYFFYADSTHNPAPGKTIFHQYFTVQKPTGTISTAGCGFWVAGALYVTDTTWLGVDIIYDSISQVLLLKNFQGDTLNFDFSISSGDSALFFENSANKYYLKAGQTQTETIYSATDMVRTFTILHFNASNQVVNSTLHGKQVKVGQQTGLISFIDTYNFPNVEKHVALQGQLNPPLGTYQMTFEELYPFQVGDSMQYQGQPGQEPCSYIINYRVLARSETAGTVTIQFGSSMVTSNTTGHPFNCSSLGIYYGSLTFPKNSDILGYPFNKMAKLSPLTGTGFEIRKEDSISSVCSKRLHYNAEAMPGAFCSSCACIGPVDAQGRAYPEIDYVKGAGMVTKQTTEFGPNIKTNFVSLTYSSIGGKVCGYYRLVGLPKYELPEFSVYPNPVENEVTISVPVDEVTVISAAGTTIQSFLQPGTTISVGQLPSGLYILQLRKGVNVSHCRIVKI